MQDFTVPMFDYCFDLFMTLPGSKSISNRVLIMAALSEQDFTFQNLAQGDDVETCRQALVAMRSDHVIDCRDSGIVTRFLLSVCAALGGEYYFDGSARMRERPIGDLLEVLMAQGVLFFEVEEKLGDLSRNPIGDFRKMIITTGFHAKFCEAKFPRDDIQRKGFFLPLRMRSEGLKGGVVRVDCGMSSQFLSGLLIAAPLVPSGMTVVASEKIMQQPYVMMTLKLMAQFGIQFEMLDAFSVRVLPGVYQGASINIEPDASTASYFFAAAALMRGAVAIANLKLDSLQGDLRFLEVLKKMGCEVSETADGVRVIGPQQLLSVGEIDMAGFSDTFMTLAVLAPFLPTPTHILGLRHARVQESDRVVAMIDGLRQVGVRCEMDDDSLIIYPSEVHAGLVDSYQDHRIAMSFGIMGLKVPGIEILGAECVSKTCPDFFSLLMQLRG